VGVSIRMQGPPYVSSPDWAVGTADGVDAAPRSHWTSLSDGPLRSSDITITIYLLTKHVPQTVYTPHNLMSDM
jgi:hypothetical protein